MANRTGSQREFRPQRAWVRFLTKALWVLFVGAFIACGLYAVYLGYEPPLYHSPK